MRAILCTIIVCSGMCCASAAFAVEPANAASGSSTTRSSPESTGDTWRYTFYRDHWWYWLPTNRWAVYDSGRWLLPPEQEPAAETHSASTVKTTGVAEEKQNAKAIKELQTELRKVAESVRRLETLVHQQGNVQAALVRGETAIVSRLLQETNQAASAEEEEARQRAEEEDRADID